MLETEDQPPSEVSVLITDKDTIQKLNREFRDVDEATDVLSWPMTGPDITGHHVLGDIAICADIAESQAKAHGQELDIELACLAVHGGLHLLGYDDDTEIGQNEMDMKMQKIMNASCLEPRLPWRSEPHQYFE